MASPADSPEGPHTLPRPELNPLLNPLLGSNMGRWAEVYFTSAPEKREEAVIELLRELEAQNASGQDSPARLPVAPALPMRTAAPVSQNTVIQNRANDLLPCNTCGHANPVTHQFCGMCGAQTLGGANEQAKTPEAYNLHRPHYERAQATAYEELGDDYREPVEEHPLRPEDEARPELYDLSQFQGLREKEYATDLEYDESPSVRYRRYIAAVVAVLILVLGYTAWRASRTDHNLQDSRLAPAPAATDADQGSARPASANPPKAVTQPPNSPASNPPATSQSKPAETPRQVEAARTERTVPTASPSSSSSPVPASYTGEQQSFGTGAEELAMAEHFLAGSNGRARDSAEAAKWLWKSISKHNGPAVLVLADLYLKGDGVSKNCDQARVLLDSAARRGTAGAGDKLRNLRAFGCQ